MFSNVIKSQTGKSLLFLSALIVVLLVPYFVFAGDNAALGGLRNVQGGSGFAEANEYSISAVLGTVVRGFLGLLGIIFTILILYGGYNWMIASGREEKVRKAQDTIRRAIIGLIVTLGAFAIWNYIWWNLIIAR
jgi:cytochrome bd-type quinol oxidase subunit 2